MTSVEVSIGIAGDLIRKGDALSCMVSKVGG